MAIETPQKRIVRLTLELRQKLVARIMYYITCCILKGSLAWLLLLASKSLLLIYWTYYGWIDDQSIDLVRGLGSDPAMDLMYDMLFAQTNEAVVLCTSSLVCLVSAVHGAKTGYRYCTAVSASGR